MADEVAGERHEVGLGGVRLGDRLHLRLHRRHAADVLVGEVRNDERFVEELRMGDVPREASNCNHAAV